MVAAIVGFFARSAVGLRLLLMVTALLMIACAGLYATVQIRDAQLEGAKAAAIALGDKIAIQNRAVETWKVEAGKQASRALEAAKKAEKVRTVTVERIRTVTVAAIPSDCPDAAKWGAEHALEFEKQWEDEE